MVSRCYSCDNHTSVMRSITRRESAWHSRAITAHFIIVQIWTLLTPPAHPLLILCSSPWTNHFYSLCRRTTLVSQLWRTQYFTQSSFIFETQDNIRTYVSKGELVICDSLSFPFQTIGLSWSHFCDLTEHLTPFTPLQWRDLLTSGPLASSQETACIYLLKKLSCI